MGITDIVQNWPNSLILLNKCLRKRKPSHPVMAAPSTLMNQKTQHSKGECLMFKPQWAFEFRLYNAASEKARLVAKPHWCLPFSHLNPEMHRGLESVECWDPIVLNCHTWCSNSRCHGYSSVFLRNFGKCNGQRHSPKHSATCSREPHLATAPKTHFKGMFWKVYLPFTLLVHRRKHSHMPRNIYNHNG